MPEVLFTIGHSNLPINVFLERMMQNRIALVIDVRSWPQSKYAPQYNKENLENSIAGAGIGYQFAGQWLGGRPVDTSLYTRGTVDYELVAATPEFKKSLDHLISQASTQRLALVCSEHDPLNCHRCLLIGKELAKKGCNVVNILRDGSLEPQVITEKRMLKFLGMDLSGDLFGPQSNDMSSAYKRMTEKVAFSGGSTRRTMTNLRPARPHSAPHAGRDA